MYKVGLAVCLSILIYSCETKEPGCLDIVADNYDVFAITECDSCCEYPQVTLSTVFKFDSIDPIVFSTLYKFSETDSIAVEDIQVTFSDFSFFAEGEELKIIDTLRNESPRVYDDFVLIERFSRTQTIGETNYLRTIDSVSFHTGLNPTVLSQIEPLESVDSDSRFTDLYNQMYVDSIPQLFQLRMDLQIGDSLRAIELKELVFQEVGFSLMQELSPGLGWSIPVYIDIRKLIEGISSEDTNEMISTTISDNFAGSIEKR